MAIKYADLLNVSADLLEYPSEEHWRSASSRAYYSAYHGCQEWHQDIGIPGSRAGAKGGVHDQFIHQLRNPAPENEAEKRVLSRRIAMSLDALKIQRHKADYNLDESFDQVIARNSHARALELLQRLL